VFTDSVWAVVEGPHCDLLEHLAERIARAALTGRHPGPPVTAVTVTLRKLRPPVAADMASAGVRIHRRREDLA
jgi:dihydroneopterin aldolase